MDSKVHVIGSTSCFQRRDDVTKNGKDLGRAFPIVSQTMGNEQNFSVLFRNDLIDPTSMLLCSTLVPSGRAAGWFHLRNEPSTSYPWVEAGHREGGWRWRPVASCGLSLHSSLGQGHHPGPSVFLAPFLTPLLAKPT